MTRNPELARDLKPRSEELGGRTHVVWLMSPRQERGREHGWPQLALGGSLDQEKQADHCGNRDASTKAQAILPENIDDDFLGCSGHDRYSSLLGYEVRRLCTRRARTEVFASVASYISVCRN